MQECLPVPLGAYTKVRSVVSISRTLAVAADLASACVQDYRFDRKLVLCGLYLAIFHLYLDQMSVEATTLEQAIMCSLLYDLPLIQYQDEICVADRA